MRRSQSLQAATLLLLLLTFGAFACKHTPAPPPPTTTITPTTTNITPPPCGAAPVITLRADSGTVLRGAAISLTWTASNATTVDVQPGIGSVTPVAGGNRQVSPASSVTYTATATGPCGTAADTLRVTVNEPPPPPPPSRGPGVVPDRGPVPTLTQQQIFERDMQPVIFDYDKSDIRDDQKGKLQKAAEYLKANPNVKVTIEGHTDERGSEEYNLALGDRRANAVRQNLISQGIAESRLGSVSYGEERPMCNEQNEDCYAKNRRAAYKNQ